MQLSDEARHTGLVVCFKNVVGPTRIATPLTQQQQSDAIINISTFTAFEPDPVFPTSCVCRAGLAADSKLFADACAKDSLRVNKV